MIFSYLFYYNTLVLLVEQKQKGLKLADFHSCLLGGIALANGDSVVF